MNEVSWGFTMAIYHLHVRFVQRSKGRSSVAASAYRAGEKLTDERTGEVFDFRHKAHVQHRDVLLPEHVPEALAEREYLWNTVETGLKRKDSQPAFEVEMALPRELSPQQRVRLVRDFAKQHFVKEGLVVDLCIHKDLASDGGEHPHCHMLITTRRWNSDGSMDKAARDMQDSPALLRKIYALEQEGKVDEALLAAKGTNLASWRKAWADYANDTLADSGSDARIDHRTLLAQRVAREALPYIGAAFHREIEGIRGWLAERVEAFKAISWRNTMRDQFERIRLSRGDLTAEFIVHARAYAKELLEGFIHKDQEKGADHDR